MNPINGAASVLVIADDPMRGEGYRDALAEGGYEVQQARSFLDVLGTEMADPDVIVLCDLAMFAYPAQNAQVLRVSAEMEPAALIAQVHRRVALRAALHAMIAQAA